MESALEESRMKVVELGEEVDGHNFYLSEMAQMEYDEDEPIVVTPTLPKYVPIIGISLAMFFIVWILIKR